jgi:hypothetical protein
MVKVNSRVASNSTGTSEFVVPFYIVRDYRKTCKLRKQRQLRKLKHLDMKRMLAEAAREIKMTQTQQINRSMLEEDEVWQLMPLSE